MTSVAVPLSPRQPRSAPHLRLYLLLAAELLLLSLIHLPASADFQKFAFYDEGAALHSDALYASGLRPTIDFGYSYGLLSLLTGRLWFALFGRTPWAYLALITTLNLLTAWPLAKIIAQLKPNGLTLLATVFFLPHAIHSTNYSITHPLEALLLCHALAAQSTRNYPRALAFATAAIFVKPTMAYIVGLLLLVAWASRPWFHQNRKKSRITTLILPALITALLCLITELLAFGPLPTLHNLLPLTGGRSYQAMNFGFFRAGTAFWLPSFHTLSETLHYYFFSPALFWITATLILFAAALLRLATALRTRTLTIRNEQIILLALLHAAFIFGFYAWSGSWTYYSYLLILGLLLTLAPTTTGLTGRTPSQPRRLALALLCLLAFLGTMNQFFDAFHRWRDTIRTPQSAGLFAYPDLLQEFQRATSDPSRTLFLTNGALPELFPDLHTPPSWFLSPSIPTPPEIATIHHQINTANRLVLVNDYGRAESWNWPEFLPHHPTFTPSFHGDYLTILDRIPPTTSTPAQQK